MRGKRQINYKFIPTGLFRGFPLIRESPDEWATTKQACRDELVVYLSFSSHNIYIALLLCIEHCFTKVKIFHFIYIYICIYIFCFLIKKVMNGACMLHIKGTISLL